MRLVAGEVKFQRYFLLLNSVLNLNLNLNSHTRLVAVVWGTAALEGSGKQSWGPVE